MERRMCLRESPSRWRLPWAGGPEHLREDFEAVAPFALENVAKDGLRARVGVDVCRVERGDAGIEGRLHAGRRLLVFDLGGVGEPVSVNDLRDFQAGVAEESVVGIEFTSKRFDPA